MDDTEQKIAQIVDLHVETARTKFEDELAEICGRCESPIERIMAAALMQVQAHYYSALRISWFGRGPLGKPGTAGEMGGFYAQATQGKYRLDFYLEMVDEGEKPWCQLAIECDGHDFHEKTKQQAQRDKERDRWLQINGISVLRFTGSEIWRDPIACADQVFDFILSAHVKR